MKMKEISYQNYFLTKWNYLSILYSPTRTEGLIEIPSIVLELSTLIIHYKF